MEPGERWEHHWFGEEEIMVFGFYAQVFEYRVGPEPFHMILSMSVQEVDSLVRRCLYPVLNLSVSDRIVYPISCL